MVTKAIFTGIVATVFLQRLFELRLSKCNEAHVIAQGGREHSSNYLKLVKVLHLSWFVVMLAEAWWFDRPFVPTLAAFALVATLAGQYLRYLSMQALGWRWALPIMTIPGASVIDKGIYRYIRHPDWLGVILEIPAVPLIHSAYLTAILYTVVNTFLLRTRIRAEEQALTEDNDYAYVFAGRPRFIPKIGFLKEANSEQ
jgi:methyltransferase